QGQLWLQLDDGVQNPSHLSENKKTKKGGKEKNKHQQVKGQITISTFTNGSGSFWNFMSNWPRRQH
ncbi:hypothetical protein ACQP3D_28980, partial [Escherichia coli]